MAPDWFFSEGNNQSWHRTSGRIYAVVSNVLIKTAMRKYDTLIIWVWSTSYVFLGQNSLFVTSWVILLTCICLHEANMPLHDCSKSSLSLNECLIQGIRSFLWSGWGRTWDKWDKRTSWWGSILEVAMVMWNSFENNGCVAYQDNKYHYSLGLVLLDLLEVSCNYAEGKGMHRKIPHSSVKESICRASGSGLHETIDTVYSIVWQRSLFGVSHRRQNCISHVLFSIHSVS